MSISSDFDPDSIIRTASRLPERPKLSSAEVKRRAETYLITPPSAELLKAYRLTVTGGVLALMHYRDLLKLAPRTIRKYTELGVLERLPDHTPKLRKVGFTEPTADLRLYTLGPVGYAMAEMEAIIAPSGYHATVDRVTHDFLATHVIMRLVTFARRLTRLPWKWHNRYQATVTHKKGGLEPDAALWLKFPSPEGESVFVLEFHNEDSGQRVPAKLFQYWWSSLHDSIKDTSPWWGNPRPTILVAAPTLAPLTAYMNAYRDPGKYHATINAHASSESPYLPPNPIYGITLQRLATQFDPACWLDLRSGKYINILTKRVLDSPPELR
jgi:hypothetical protein